MRRFSFLLVLVLVLDLILVLPTLALLPYNFRQIDTNIYAGGHPLGPENGLKNSDQQVQEILAGLKAKGVRQIIDLENTRSIQNRYEANLQKADLTRLHTPLSQLKVPTEKEWQMIRAVLQKPVYIHCKWGADRTGAVIGRYLVEEKGYNAQDAYAAVITGGKFAGPRGGLKQNPAYWRLKKFIWAVSKSR